MVFALILSYALAAPDSLDRDYASELPRIAPVEAADALSTFKVHPDFELQLIASEPLIRDPIAMAFDEDARCYVVEMTGYSEQRDSIPGTIRLLEDTDGDGVYDKGTPFLDGLPWPVAVACYDGGVFVGVPPDILYAKDTDGDGIADVKETVFTGFAYTNVQGMMNTFLWGVDNRIHGATSSSGGKVTRVPSGHFDQPHNEGDQPPRHFDQREKSHPHQVDEQHLLPPTGETSPVGRGDTVGRGEGAIGDLRSRGVAGSETTATANDEPVELGGRDFGFDPRTLTLAAESGGAQHGMSFDDWGNKYVCHNSDHFQWCWYEDRYTAANPWFAPSAPRESIAVDGPAATVFRISPVEPWREVRTRLRVQGLVPGPIEGGGRAAGYFTSATGVTIYRGDAWPTDYRGQAFIADVGSNLIHRKLVQRDGLNVKGVRADEGVEFIASTDIWFRPVQFANAPDGCLYIADMYREVIEHPDSLPPIIKKHLDLTSGNDRGRIWRIAPKGYKFAAPPRLSTYATADLVPMLAYANLWHRQTASRLIFERQDKSIVSALEALANESTEPLGRIHALFALDGLAALTPAHVAAALQDADDNVRRHALLLAEEHMDAFDVRAQVLARAQDADAWVQLQAAWTLGLAPEDERVPALALLAGAHPAEPRMRTAVLVSAAASSGRLAQMLSADESFSASPDAEAWLTELAHVAGACGKPAEAAAVLEGVESLKVRQAALADAMLLALAKANPAAATGGNAESMLAHLMADAAEAAANADLDAAARAQAVAALRAAPADNARPLLLSLISAQTPEEVQAAALDSLGAMNDESVAAALIDAWSTFSPARRAQAIEILFRREVSLRALLDSVKGGAIPARDLDSTRVHALRNHSNPDIRAMAEELFAAPTSTREEVVQRYAEALTLKGDAARGAKVFETNCTPCHKVRGMGNDVGPNLATVAQAGAEKILVNVLDPNRELNPQYTNYTIETSDFETHTGIIVAETANSITLKRAHGETDVVPREAIESIRSDALSIMPEGLEQAIDPQAMADLIAFITSSE